MNFNLRLQATIMSPVEFNGIGVHSGIETRMKVIPASENSGIIFKRTDIPDKNPFINLSPDSVVDPTLCTRVVNKDGVSVSVIEHLMAAFRIVGITNAIVEVNSQEVPIMDGSSSVFVSEFKKSGIIKQNEYVKAIVVKHPICVESKNGKILLSPSDRLNINITISYDRINPVIQENNSYSFNMEENLSELSMARTFGWIDDYEKIKSMGLGLGSSLENTIGISRDNMIVNKEGLRHPKELVMHKCLDLIGDISVIGYDIIGKIDGINTSHSLNNSIMRRLIEEINQHEIISGPDTDSFQNMNLAVY